MSHVEEEDYDKVCDKLSKVDFVFSRAESVLSFSFFSFLGES